MSNSEHKKIDPTEHDIDRLVIAQADDDAAWEDPIPVRPVEQAAVKLPAGLTARAAFLARLHRTSSVEEWLTRVIQERIELEEAAFAGLKQDLAAKST